MLSLIRTARVFLLASLFLSGCAIAPLDKAHNQFEQGQPEAAIETLENVNNPSKRSSLLFFMNKGLIFHHLGEYKKSIREFLNASELIESQDYISLSEQTTTLLSNDWLATYKGEYSERLWVHTYQMMNYLILGQYQSAAVEARQSLKVLERYPQALKQDWFTKALIGLSFEGVGKSNDAYIVYKKLAQKLPNDTAIAKQLYWLARQLGFSKDAKKYKALIPKKLKGLDPSKQGELILFIANNSLPEKISSEIYAPPNIRISFPRYRDSFSPSPVLRVENAKQEIPFTAVSSNLGELARASLDARGKKIFAKHVARAGVKQALVHNLRSEDEAAAELLNLLFFLLENADTRGWATLPGNLTLLRIPLNPGTHDIAISTGTRPQALREVYRFEDLSIAAGQRIYRKIRR